MASVLTPLVCCVLITATPARIASIGFKAVGVDEQKAQFFAGDFALQLQAATGISVVTPEEIGAVLGVERQRQLLGCSDATTSCLAELAGGLGASIILQGTVARVGDAWALTVKLVDMKDASIVAARSGQVSREADVLAWLAQTAREVAPTLRGRLKSADSEDAKVSLSATETGLKRLGWIPALAGGALAVGGGVMLAIAHGAAGGIAQGDRSITSAAGLEESLRQATAFQTSAFVLWGVSAAAWVTAAAFWIFGESSSGVTVSVLASPQGSGLVVGGGW